MVQEGIFIISMTRKISIHNFVSLQSTQMGKDTLTLQSQGVLMVICCIISAIAYLIRDQK
jgi:hypothetical protein